MRSESLSHSGTEFIYLSRVISRDDSDKKDGLFSFSRLEGKDGRRVSPIDPKPSPTNPPDWTPRGVKFLESGEVTLCDPSFLGEYLEGRNRGVAPQEWHDSSGSVPGLSGTGAPSEGEGRRRGQRQGS